MRLTANDMLYVSTRKGLMIFANSGIGWTLANMAFRSEPASMTLRSKDRRTIIAALNLGHFGVKRHRSDDGGGTWTELDPPRFPKAEAPDDKAPSLAGIWSLAWAGPKGHVWCGTAPGGLFHSTDNGASWTLVEGLWLHPDRKRWFGGGTVDPAIHSIAVNPRDHNQVAIAWFVPTDNDQTRIPIDGKVVVTRTRDGGKTFDVIRNGFPQDNAYDLIWRHGLAVNDTASWLAMGSSTNWTLMSAHLPRSTRGVSPNVIA